MDLHGKWGRWMQPMNLQLFAEDGAADGAAGGDAQGGTADDGARGGADRMFTLEEVTQLIQSETDKRVTQALKKQEKQFEKKLSLSGLDEQQRAQAEKDQRIQELEDRLRESDRERNRLELARTLAGRDLPAVFADLIEVGEDPDAAQQKIDALDKAFRTAVEDAVNKRFAGRRAPGKGGAGGTMSVSDIMKIRDHTERQKAIEDNMELFSKKG